jgi:hypothetical protein
MQSAQLRADAIAIFRQTASPFQVRWFQIGNGSFASPAATRLPPGTRRVLRPMMAHPQRSFFRSKPCDKVRDVFGLIRDREHRVFGPHFALAGHRRPSSGKPMDRPREDRGRE